MRDKVWIAAFLAVAGCGGVPQDCPPPGVVGPHDGNASVLVCARDAVSGAAIAGASVEERRGGALVTTGTTDAAGRFELPAGTTDADHEVSVHAPGYAALSFVGFDARAMTLPLTLLAPAHTTLSITISGLDTLDVSGASSVQVYFAPSATVTMADLPTIASTIDRHPVCTLSTPLASSTCTANASFSSGARAGVVTVTTVDDQGTPDPSDDVLSVAGFGVVRGIDTSSPALTIAVRPVASAALDVRLTSPPSGATAVVGVPGLAAGAEGVALLPHIASLDAPQLALPFDDPARGDATFWVLGLATNATGSSLVLRRGLADASTAVTLDGWLDVPVVDRVGGMPEPPVRDAAVMPVDGATLYAVDTLAADGSVAHRRYFAAHATASTGDRVTAIDGPATASALDLAALDRGTTRLSFLTLP